MPPFAARRWLLSSVSVVLASGAVAAAQGARADAGQHGGLASAAPCSSDVPAPGGDWPSYGGSPHATRSQPAETGIGTAQVAVGLVPKWVFSGAAEGGAGGVNGTPVESNGCVFVGTSAGWVYSIDASSGKLVWKTQLSAPNPGFGGAIVGSPAVWDHRVYILVNQTADKSGTTGPYVVALDESAGKMLWQSPPVATYNGDYTNASPIVMPVAGGNEDARVVFAGFSPPEGDPHGQGGFALVDAGSGRIVDTTFTVPPARQAQGYAGGGIWSTPAYDPATGYAYVGAGNPYSKSQEDQNTNAILKIDLHQGRLGQIAGSYKGNVDQYTNTLQTLATSPACTATDGQDTPLDDPVCGQLDLDFGASPNLFTGSKGELLVGDLQKAGVYHVAKTADMSPAWATLVGGPCHFCNAGTTAVDGPGHVFGVAAPGGIAFGLDNTGPEVWQSPIGDGAHYESTSTADGVVYTFDNYGILEALNAATGSSLWRHPLAADTRQPMVALTSAGISVARHLVLVAASGGAAGAAGAATAPPSQLPSSTADAFVIAYGLPG